MISIANTMKHITTSLIVFLSILITSSSFSQEVQKIKWLTWNEAIEQQKKDLKIFNETGEGVEKVPPKKIFLDVYTSWCGWCKRMDATTFSDPTIIQIMNQYFYPVKMDAEMKENIVFNDHNFINPNPEGKRSTHQFAASILDYGLSYPSYVLLDENTNRLTIYKGYKQVDDLLGILLFFGKNQHLSYKQGIEKQIELQNSQQSGQ